MTFKLSLTFDMFLLTIVFGYTGIELAFSTGIYATCLSFTKQFDYNSHQLVGLAAIANGIGELIGIQ